MSRIFISYKRVDKDKVFLIKDKIESALGEKCWIDIDGIESDAQFMNVIIKAIRECEVLLFMYSKTHAQITDFEKDWTVRELNFASKKEKRIVFVNIDGSPLSDEFEFMYGTKQQVDAMSENAMNKLYTDLRTWLNITTLLPNTSELAVSLLPSTKSNSESLTFKVGDVEFNMIYVEGGTFMMGATSQIVNNQDDEKPLHQVTLSPYYIGETAVTQALWKAVMGNNPSAIKWDNVPIMDISWNDCQIFIKKLRLILKKEFRLLTEAEWEFAARGGNKSKDYPYSGSDTIDDVAWYCENMGDDNCMVVKQKMANELGLFDMSGSVYEWCQDWYGAYESRTQKNPKGPQRGVYRVMRGGDWSEEASQCTCFHRSSCLPDNDGGGFRLALSV